MERAILSTVMRFAGKYMKWTGRTSMLLAGLYLSMMFLTMALGSLVRPDATTDANRQHRASALLPPLSSQEFLRVARNTRRPEQSKLSRWWNGVQNEPDEWIPYSSVEWVNGHQIRLVKKGGSEPLILDAIDVVAPIRSLGTCDDDQCSFIDIQGESRTMDIDDLHRQVQERFESRTFWLGTDEFGRDYLSRFMLGGSNSLITGVLSAFFSLFIGLAVAMIAGYFGGWADRLLSLLINVFLSIPAVVFVIALAMLFSGSILSLSIAIGSILWVELAQVIRGEILSLRQKEFVKAAQLTGQSWYDILRAEILPNISGLILVLVVSAFAEAILLEAGLSFIGVGLQLPTPSWGGMIRSSYGYLLSDHAYLIVIPGLALVALIWSVMTVSNGLKRHEGQ